MKLRIILKSNNILKNIILKKVLDFSSTFFVCENKFFIYKGKKIFIYKDKKNMITSFHKFNQIVFKKYFETLYCDVNEAIDDIYKYVPFNVERYYTKYENVYDTTYFFSTKTGISYRLDFKNFKEPDESLISDERLHGKIFVNISFSTRNVKKKDYDKQTYLNDVYDLMNRIVCLIRCYVEEYLPKNNEYVFMIGDVEDERKMKLYKYVIKNCFPMFDVVVDYTSNYLNKHVGFYLLKRD
jgi:hypothetical protein